MKGGRCYRQLLGVGVLVVSAACSGSGDTTTSVAAPPNSTAATAISTTTVARTSVGVPEDPVPVLEAFASALNDGEVDRALAMLAPGAVFSTPEGIELELDAPLPEELRWAVEAFGLPADATGRHALRAFFDEQSALGTQRILEDCRADGSLAECDYSATFAASEIVGRAEEGEWRVTAENGLIASLMVDSREVRVDRAADADAFLRWAAVTEPGLDLAREAAGSVMLIEDWVAAGRPDVAAPSGLGEDPVAVIQAWLDARQAGDWRGHVALLAEEALLQEMGSRDDFEAAGLLRRELTLSDCGVTLESERVGQVVGCVVTVSDIITEVVGAEPSNPNVSTWQVKEGRVTSLPEFIPSLFLAEEALELWGAATYPSEYAAACPVGITNPLGIEDASCARFLVDHLGEWDEAVLEPYG